MTPIDRIIWMPVLNLYPPAKEEYKGRGGKAGREPWSEFRPLKHSKAINDVFGTGCDKHDDCFTCPEILYKNCELGEGNGKKK